MAVITFDNVQGRSDAAGVQLLKQAGESIDSGFEKFGGIIDDARDLRKENAAIVGQNATDAFKDKIASYTTEAELQAAEDSGELDTLRAASIKSGADRSVLRDESGNRQDTIRSETLADQSFVKDQLEKELAPTIDRYQAQVAEGDIEGATKTLEENEANLAEINKLASATQALESKKVAKTEAERAEQKFLATQAAIASNTAKESLIKESLEFFSTLSQAKNHIMLNGDKKGLSDGDISKGVAELVEQFKTLNNLDDEGLAQLEAVEKRAIIAATREKAIATQALEEITSANEVIPAYNFDDIALKSTTDAIKTAEGNKWDANPIFRFQSVASVINDVEERFIETIRQDRIKAFRSENNRAPNRQEAKDIVDDVVSYLPHIMNMSAGQLGEEDSILWGRNNLPAAALETLVGKNWEKYQTNIKNRQIVSTARTEYNDAMAAADTGILVKTDAEKARLKLGILSARNNQR